MRAPSPHPRSAGVRHGLLTFAARMVVIAVASCLAWAGCDDAGGDAPTGVNPAPFGAPWDTLAAWGLFDDVTAQVPAEGVVPYTVNAQLFSDFTAKHRFIWVPDGDAIGYTDDGPWALPLGAIVVKTFAQPRDARDPALGERLLETRLIVHEPTGWTPYTYVYGPDAPTEAPLRKAGAVIPVTWTDEAGETRANDYVVPTLSECRECHGDQGETRLLGVKSAQLDRPNVYGGEAVNQIDHVAATIGFDATPTPAAARDPMPDPFGDAPLDDRARAYLDANCGHCHSPLGDAAEKSLYLNWERTADARPSELGVCKVPTSAGGASCGLTYDIVPGDPDASVMACRVASTERQIQMPPVGRNLQDARGVALIRAWIAEMPAADCGR